MENKIYNKSDEGYGSTESLKVVKKQPDFKAIQLLQSSKTASVYLGLYEGQKVVIKKMIRSEQSILEIQLAKAAYKLCPETTLPVLFCMKTNTTVTYIQPFYGMSLYDFMTTRKRPLTLAEAKKVFSQLAFTIYVLQKHGIYHLDIKEENLLIDPQDFSIKLIDFGCASKHNFITSPRGSPEFACPEMFGDLQENDISKFDVWSLGVMIFSSLTGNLPYESMQTVFEQGIDYKVLKLVSKQIRDCIFGCLQVDYSQRYSIKDVMHSKFLRDMYDF